MHKVETGYARAIRAVAKVGMYGLAHVLAQLSFAWALDDDVVSNSVSDEAPVNLILGYLKKDL